MKTKTMTLDNNEREFWKTKPAAGFLMEYPDFLAIEVHPSIAIKKDSNINNSQIILKQHLVNNKFLHELILKFQIYASFQRQEYCIFLNLCQQILR